MTRSTSILAVAMLAFLIVGPSGASARCFNKAAEGTSVTASGAKFQAFEAILQSFSWGTWATWMATQTTPGYRIKTRYKCSKSTGLGTTCRAYSRICTH